MLPWQPITDLPGDWPSLAQDDVRALAQVWREQRVRLEPTPAFQEFMKRMRREIAIETGLIERLYTLDRGVTQVLIEQGLDEALLPHGALGQSPAQVMRLIRDQAKAIDDVFRLVKDEQPLSEFVIRSLHQMLTEHQGDVEALDPFGKLMRVPLERGGYKRH